MKRSAYLLLAILGLPFSDSLIVNSFSQVPGKDILTDNYIIGNSAEIFTIRAENDTVEFRIFDAVGNINDGGIIEKEKKYILEKEWQSYKYGSAVSIISGNFNGDRYTDVVAAWEARDTNIAMYIPKIDPTSMKISSDQRIHLIETGMPEMYNSNNSLPRAISLNKGQFDEDQEEELVLGYMADRENGEGGPVFIAIYDMDKVSGALVLKDSLSTVMLRPGINNARNGISRGSLFDISTADFNQDGMDEIVIAAVTPYSNDEDYEWRLDAYIYQMNNGELDFVVQTDDPIYKANARSSDYFRRLALVAGNFDNDFQPDIAVSYQVVETGAGDSDIYLRALKATGDSFGIMGRETRIGGSNGNNGWPISMRARDADRDGLDEVQLAVRNTLSSYSFDENMNKISRPSPVYASGLRTNRADAFTSTFAGTDMDLADCDSLKTEIALIDDRGLVIYQKLNSQGQFEPIEEVDFRANGMTEGDFDGDALRLGPPRRQTISNVIQPLMVLSSPPVHFDIFDEVVFDLQDCYPVFEASENCKTSSVYYTKTQEKEIESSVEISSTWTKTDLPIEIGGPAGPVLRADYLEIGDRLLNMELNKIYGGGSTDRKRSSQSFTFSSRTETTEDDNIQCLISEYELLEYPVYSGETLIRYVLLVEPAQNNSKTRIQWIPFRSSSARNYHATHEVGNILSYPKNTTLPPGARPFGLGGYEGGLDTWTVTPSSTGNWNMMFSSETIDERESTSSQTISNDVRGSIGVSFVAEASLDFEYLDNKTYEEIKSIKTTIKESSEINISIGKINTSLIGTKTYNITPFLYWDASGALILDYAVSPDFSAGVASWWEDKYGKNPDLTFNLPWRYSESKGLGGSDDDLQSKQTYDIISSRLNPREGDTTNIMARIQNYSNVDVFSDVKVRFYLGDPDNNGTLIVNKDGKSEVVLSQVNAREPVIARLDSWIVPSSISEESLLFAVIDEDDLIVEVHENNNKAWSLLNPGVTTTITSTDKISRDNTSHSQDNFVSVFPNPVKDQAMFRYDLAAGSLVELALYDVQGRLVKRFPKEYKQAGSHTQSFDISDFDKGVYIYFFSSGDYSESGKMVVLD